MPDRHEIRMRRRGGSSRPIACRACRTAMLALLLLAPPVAAAQSSTRPADEPGWSLDFVANEKLPTPFRQAQAARSDGSRMTFFLGDFKNGLSGRKPLLVWLEGSGAQSHFMTVGDKIGYGIFGLIAQRAGGDFHVAAIEKRGVSFGESQRPGSGEGASAEYAKHATLADRAADLRLLLDVLLSQPAVDASRVVLLGHSEGADVAAAAAAEDPRVTHVAFLSGGGAAQFFDLFVLRRAGMKQAGASPEQIEQSITELEQNMRDILDQPDSEQRHFMGHAYKRWATFATQPAAENLARCKAKILIGHGSEDTSVPIESFDFLVVELLRRGRTDVTIRRYPGRDHSFNKPGEKPSGDAFMKVVDEVLEWAGP